jgi:hypothetical protein
MNIGFGFPAGALPKSKFARNDPDNDDGKDT